MAQLQKERDAKYAQIVALVAEKLKASPETVPEGEVRELINNYAEADVDPRRSVPIATTLWRLLAEHHDLGERMRDFRDEALG